MDEIKSTVITLKDALIQVGHAGKIFMPLWYYLGGGLLDVIVKKSTPFS